MAPVFLCQCPASAFSPTEDFIQSQEVKMWETLHLEKVDSSDVSVTRVCQEKDQKIIASFY